MLPESLIYQVAPMGATKIERETLQGPTRAPLVPDVPVMLGLLYAWDVLYLPEK